MECEQMEGIYTANIFALWNLSINQFFFFFLFISGKLEKQSSDLSAGIPWRAQVRGDGRTSVCLSRLIASVPYQQPCQVQYKML